MRKCVTSYRITASTEFIISDVINHIQTQITNLFNRKKSSDIKKTKFEKNESSILLLGHTVTRTYKIIVENRKIFPE